MSHAVNIPSDVCFVCIHWGDKYPFLYVERLQRALHRHCSTTLDFVCVSNNEAMCREVTADIRVVPAPNTLQGWWQKINLFNRDFMEYRHIIYCDLDVVVMKNIDEIVDMIGKYEFIHAQDVLDDLSSSFMIIDRDSLFARDVFATFNPDYAKIVDCGDQWYLKKFLDQDKYRIGSLTPEQHYSYKYLIDHTNWRIRSTNLLYRAVDIEGVSMLNFHGTPNPHDLESNPDAWPFSVPIVGQWSSSKFDVQCLDRPNTTPPCATPNNQT